MQDEASNSNQYKQFKRTSLSRQQLIDELNVICAQIDSVKKIVKEQGQLDKYLAKAKTNQKQVIEALEHLLTHLKDLNPVIKNKQFVNVYALHNIFSYVGSYLSQKILNTLTIQELAVWIIEFETKFLTTVEFLDSAVSIAEDITFQQPDQQKSQFWSKIEFNSLGNAKKLKDSHEYLGKMTTVTAAAVLAQQKKSNVLMKKIVFGTAFSRYMMKYNEAQLIAMGFYRKPQVRMASKIWNTPEMGMIKQMSKMVLDKIGTNQKIWIPVCKFELKPDIHKKEYANSVSVRVLHHKPLKFYHKNTSKFSCCECNQEQENKQIDTIMIHMHGGGFIAMSSSSMQIYTRRWANHLKIPIFSVDYRMPPDFPFPQPAEDCLAVYEFITNHISYYMNIRPKNIILAGDSAGGNLAASLMVQIIKKGLVMPKGMFLAYPALDLRKKYSPSLFNAFNDPLLKPTTLLLCLNQYLNYQLSNALNPIASPLLATQQFVNGKNSEGDTRFPLKWPKTLVFVGKKDPLYDDAIRLAYKLHTNNTEFKLKVYENFCHGFFNLSFIIPECDQIIKQSSVMIKRQLLDLIEKTTADNQSQKQDTHQQDILKTYRDSHLQLVKNLIKKQEEVAQI